MEISIVGNLNLGLLLLFVVEVSGCGDTESNSSESVGVVGVVGAL